MKLLVVTLCALLLTALNSQISVQAADTASDSAAKVPPKKDSGFHNVGVQEFEKLRADKKNIVLDVRTAKEYTAGHIPGAINIDVNGMDFEKKISELDPKKTYLVHCAAGVRSGKACDRLSKLHFSQLYNLKGGMNAWQEAGNKAEK